ncbi:MAG: Holliday junction branch migration DNA helicase RuvB [Aquificae bacterium]|nr:Holliday junction branch migration DNA helicase RuvB [Aquificota bacterium]
MAEAYKLNIRPTTLDEYIGQEHIKENLKVFIKATQKRNSYLDHILLAGPAGLGKTTLAQIVANELQVQLKITSGNILDKKGDLAGILTSLDEGDILFIDEIHRLNPSIEETLYSAMEDFKVDIIIGKGKTARSIRIEIKPFTLIGATTRTGLLTAPLLSRFGIILNFDYYSVESLKEIVKRTAKILNTPIDEKSAEEIAKRSRGTPRIANKLVKRVIDFVTIKHNSKLNLQNTIEAFEFLGIDKYGLNPLDRKYLHILIELFNCKPVGINTISMALNENKETIEEMIEPYLLRIGMIDKTPKGRVPTKKAVNHIKSI